MSPHAHHEALLAARRHAGLFRVVDHEALPGALVGLTVLVAALIALIGLDGRIHLSDGETLTPPAWLALLAVAVLAVLGASEAGAWLLSRRVGREAARAVSQLERAHRRVAGITVATRGDAALDAAGARIERGRTDLVARLAQLDAGLMLAGRLADPRLRAAQLARIRAASLAVDRAAAAFSDAARVLRSSATSPWELTHAEAVAELDRDLDHAERLLHAS